MDDIHPIYIPRGYMIYTMPAERYLNYIIDGIRGDNHGEFADGVGRIGKTLIAAYLAKHFSLWLQQVGGGVATRLIVPSTTRRSDGAFFATVGGGLQLDANTKPSDKRKKDRIVNYILNRCGAAGTHLLVMFVDNAQNITRKELDYLIDLDDEIEEHGVRLFLAFIRQSDTDGLSMSQSFSNFPSHITGRWNMDSSSHVMTGLIGLSDATHALRRYHTEAFWREKCFVEYFAPSAVKAGWTMDSDAPLIMEVVQELRSKAGLDPGGDWPMKTFTSTVKYLLTEVAARDPSFRGFKREHIKAALKASGYLKLELVHAGVVPEVTA